MLEPVFCGNGIMGILCKFLFYIILISALVLIYFILSKPRSRRWE